MKHSARVAAGLFFAVLAGCGGGGGGGGAGGANDALQYSGNSNAAVITASNAGTLAANSTNPTDGAVAIPTDGGAVSGVTVRAVAGSEAHVSQGLLDATRRLTQSARASAANPHRNSDVRLSVIPIDATNACQDGGSVRVLGDLSDSGTGTLNITYSNCTEGSDSLTGNATLRVDAAVLPPGAVILTDFTLSFVRLALRGEVNIDLGGSIRVQTDVPANTETITENVVALFISTGGMTRFESVVLVDIYDNLDNPTSYTESVTGRVYHSVHGFVDISTSSQLVFPSVDQPFPSGGELVLTGASNRRISVTATSATRVLLRLDLDGDGVFEGQARLGWTELSGPVGADLADTDGDGMHNSWESAFGLNPNVPDAAGDPDGDGFSNLSEYQTGSSPVASPSIPQFAVGGVVAAVSNIATANSGLDVPGRSVIASDGTNFLLLSCRELGATPGVFGVLISPTGKVLNNFPIAIGNCLGKAVAFDGVNYLVVLTPAPGEVRGVRITRSGVVLDSPAFLIASPSFNTVNHMPAVAFDGTNYLVLWVNSSISGRIRARRVTPAGVVLGADFPITRNEINAFEFGPFVAFDGTNFLVVWTRGSVPENENAFGARVTRDGTVLDSPEIPIVTLANQQRAAGVAFDGTNYLVVWNHAVNISVIPPPDGQIFGRRLTQAGTLLDGTADSAGIPIATGQFGSPGSLVGNHSSSVAFAGNSFLVTWAVGHFPNFPPAGIHAARIAPGGSRLDGLPTALGIPVSGPPPAASRYVLPVVASSGQNALITWVNNTELFGTQKDILAAPVLSP